jgi:hypothetical protein
MQLGLGPKTQVLESPVLWLMVKTALPGELKTSLLTPLHPLHFNQSIYLFIYLFLLLGTDPKAAHELGMCSTT